VLISIFGSLTAEQYIIRFNVSGAKNASLVQELAAKGEDIAARGKNYIDLVIDKERMAEFANLQPKIIFDHDPVASLRSKGDLGNYHTYYEMLTEMQTLAAANPGIMKIINLGPAWEKANNVAGADRDLIAIKISDNVDLDENEPQILLDAAHHAREIITPEIIISVVNRLISGYNSNDPEMKYLVNERETYLVPIVNPDGHTYVANVNGMWRKNRHKYGSYYGADLNRNYGYHWGEAGASSSPSQDTYRGSAAFSEPETAIMRDFSRTKNFVFNISYHSYSNLILFPWGYDGTVNNPDRAVYEQLSDSMAAVNGYNYGTPVEWLYDASGGSFDWQYGDTTKPQTLGFSPEIGTIDDGFAPPESRRIALINENLPNCIFLIRQADDPYIKRPAMTGNNLTGTVWSYAPHHFDVFTTFNSSVPLDSVSISYKCTDDTLYTTQKLANEPNNSFRGNQLYLSYEGYGDVSYYYTGWFTHKNKTFKITYPQFGETTPLHFTYTWETGINDGAQISTTNLLSAYPNPFNSTTRLNLNLVEEQIVDISLFDISGREVQKIAHSQNLSAGRHGFDLTLHLSAGIYFVRTTGSKLSSPLLQKITYLK